MDARLLCRSCIINKCDPKKKRSSVADIHFKDLYVVNSQLLLVAATPTCGKIGHSIEAAVVHVSRNPGKMLLVRTSRTPSVAGTDPAV